MTTLTLIYATDYQGNLCPDKGSIATWRDFYPEADEFVQQYIRGKSVIVDERFFMSEWRSLYDCKMVTVLAHEEGWSSRYHKMFKDDVSDKTLPCWSSEKTIMRSIALAQESWRADRSRQIADEVVVLGTRECIEAYAPFASKVKIAYIVTGGTRIVWTPDIIDDEIVSNNGSPDLDTSIYSQWDYLDERGKLKSFDGFIPEDKQNSLKSGDIYKMDIVRTNRILF